MSLKTGIIGLPNVGKSTLFNAITKLNVEAANYPFATIEPNIAVIPVIDERLDNLSNSFKTEKKTYTTFKFFDIAGLVKGASKGEGLGNKFLSQIRECDVLVEVVRCFENNDIVHVEGSVEPKRDIKIIELELLASDCEVINNRIKKNQEKLKKDPNNKTVIFEMKALEEAKKHVDSLEMLNLFQFEKEVYDYFFYDLKLFSIKPFVFVANISESDLNKDDFFIDKIRNAVGKKDIYVVPICCDFEQQLSILSDSEKKDFLQSNSFQVESGINRLTRICYKLLGLSTFFTVGKDECKAWTFKNGSTAEECAGIIHSDIKRGFIKAEVYNYDDFKIFKDEKVIRENGKIRFEGKEYKIQDGDIVFFRFNV